MVNGSPPFPALPVWNGVKMCLAIRAGTGPCQNPPGVLLGSTRCNDDDLGLWLDAPRVVVYFGACDYLFEQTRSKGSGGGLSRLPIATSPVPGFSHAEADGPARQLLRARAPGICHWPPAQKAQALTLRRGSACFQSILRQPLRPPPGGLGLAAGGTVR